MVSLECEKYIIDCYEAGMDEVEISFNIVSKFSDCTLEDIKRVVDERNESIQGY